MAAASNVYLLNGAGTFPIHIEGEIKLDSYPALPLAEYGQNILSLFYLDALIMLDDQQGTTAFVGVVSSNETALNFKMHNPSRFFNARIAPDSTGLAHYVMNDAGLNTLGIVLGDLAFSNLETGSITVNGVTFKSAYWVDSTSYGFKHKINDGAFLEVNQGGLPQQVSVAGSRNFGNNGKAGNWIYVKAFITNPEGTFETAVIQGYILPKSIMTSFTDSFASQACAGVFTTRVYIDETLIAEGGRMWKDVNMTVDADPGFYSINGFWYNFRSKDGIMQVIASGPCINGGYPPGDPGNLAAYTTRSYYGYNTDYAYDAAFQARGSNNVYTFYYNGSVGKYYANTSSAQAGGTSGYVTNGWYVDLKDGGSYRCRHIVSGSIIESEIITI